MAITREQVEGLALLARLKLDEAEIERLRGELSSILGYVRKLEELDTSGVEPMTHVTLAAPLREDAVAPSLSPDEALAAAPARADDCFEVPRIIEVPR